MSKTTTTNRLDDLYPAPNRHHGETMLAWSRSILKEMTAAGQIWLPQETDFESIARAFVRERHDELVSEPRVALSDIDKYLDDWMVEPAREAITAVIEAQERGEVEDLPIARVIIAWEKLSHDSVLIDAAIHDYTNREVAEIFAQFLAATAAAGVAPHEAEGRA